MLPWPRHDAVGQRVDRHVEDARERVRIGRLAREQEHVQVRGIGRRRHARAARPANRNASTCDARQQRDLRGVWQREHGAAISTAPNPQAERARPAGSRARNRRARPRAPHDSRHDGPRISWPRNACTAACIPRPAGHARRRGSRRRSARASRTAGAALRAALDDRDLQRTAALPAQCVRPRRVLRAAHASGTRAPQSRPAHAREAATTARVVLDDLPAVRHAVRAFEHRAADDDAILVARELHPVRETGRRRRRRSPTAGRPARSAAAALRRPRACRPPARNRRPNSSPCVRCNCDARADTVETAARRCDPHRARAAHRRCARRRTYTARFGISAAPSTKYSERARESRSASALAGRTGQSCEQAPVARAAQGVAVAPAVTPAPVLSALAGSAAGGIRQLRSGIYAANRPGCAPPAKPRACIWSATCAASRASTTVTSLRARLSRALPHERVAGRRAAGRVDRVQAAGFQLRPRIGQAVDREPAHRADTAAGRRLSSARRRPAGRRRRMQDGWHRVPYSRRSPSNPNKAAPASA